MDLRWRTDTGCRKRRFALGLLIFLMLMFVSPLGPIFTLADYSRLPMSPEMRAKYAAIDGDVRSVSMAGPPYYVAVSEWRGTAVVWISGSRVDGGHRAIMSAARRSVLEHDESAKRLAVRDIVTGRLVEDVDLK